MLAAGIVLGICLGSFCTLHFSAGKRLSIINNSSNKLNDLLHIINDEYVDTVNISDLVEKSLPKILQELDPHSTYIGAKDVEASMQDLNGRFSGIGVQFAIIRDTVCVVKVIPGGPSEGIGLQAGDRIVSVDGRPYVGKEVTSEETLNRLRGPYDSKVKLGIVRRGVPRKLSYEITRGDVPVETVDAVYMANANTGYIRITSFGENTYSEFLSALAQLGSSDFQHLIIDLRGNLGGYLNSAVMVANEFLTKNRLIVYTEGRRSPREEYTSDGRGSFQTLPLIVLVDEGSASASEILAGAIQDNDRGLILGRRSFGKGLVQVPIEFADGSMLRITKARYYTPSGRCVQKPYTPGDEEAYEQDLILRAESGEYYNPDSIKTSGEKYRTSLGRTVYGGGGIIPDEFVPRDTSDITSYFRDVYLQQIPFEFAFLFSDAYRKQLSQFSEAEDIVKFLRRHRAVEQMADYAETCGVKRRNLMIKKSYKLFETYLYGYIIDEFLGVSASAEYINQTDPAVQLALRLFKEEKSFPSIGGLSKKNGRKSLHSCLSPFSGNVRGLLAYDLGTYWRYSWQMLTQKTIAEYYNHQENNLL